MIVSFHPLFETDKNVICAGRDPDADDLAAIKAAAAVVLPQGCRQSLYEMARDNCRHVFPNYRVRFNFPGKIGQIKLFRETGTAHPAAELYPTVAEFKEHYGETPEDISFGLPCVFKFDWGGEGETVYLINSPGELKEVLKKAAVFENSGQKGFLLQQYVPSNGRTLRVIIIGQAMISYWRIQQSSDGFMSSVSRGHISTPPHCLSCRRPPGTLYMIFALKPASTWPDLMLSSRPKRKTPSRFLLKKKNFSAAGGWADPTQIIKI
jgi:ribosomal protein S6--L-glutamate ligase